MVGSERSEAADSPQDDGRLSSRTKSELIVSERTRRRMTERGLAILATAVALALINVGLAGVIVEAIGARSFAPLWLEVALLLLGVIAAVGAFTLWRAYLQSERDPSPTDQ